jgi:glycosyltransferase involved in cell wall biosynthesis
MTIYSKNFRPEVSIGMPVYNGENFIREALDSLLAQTFTDFELIISDNASTDGTEAICREYASHDSRIRYVRQNENRGACANFQFVLDEAIGKYFMWAACDDHWEKHFLDCALNLINSSNVGFAFPTFALRSISLGISVNIPKNIFNFIEDIDRNRRILSFANLHHLSYKCNIVYSLFRTEIIKTVSAIQNISNDGLMGMVLLGITRGVIVDGFLFSKRYKMFWPGYRKKSFLNLVNRKRRKDFNIKRDKNFSAAVALFPELSKPLNEIRIAYKRYRFHSNYRILNRNIFF